MGQYKKRNINCRGNHVVGRHRRVIERCGRGRHARTDYRKRRAQKCPSTLKASIDRDDVWPVGSQTLYCLRCRDVLAMARIVRSRLLLRLWDKGELVLALIFGSMKYEVDWRCICVQ